MISQLDLRICLAGLSERPHNDRHQENSPSDDLLGPLPSGNSSGDEPFSLDPVPTPKKQYALTMLAHLVEMGVLTRREFDVLHARMRES